MTTDTSEKQRMCRSSLIVVLTALAGANAFSVGPAGRIVAVSQPALPRASKPVATMPMIDGMSTGVTAVTMQL